MKEEIISAIKMQSGKINFKNLSKKFNIKTNELNVIIKELKTEGKILERNNKFEIFPDDLYIGTVNVSTVGNKYLFHKGGRLPIINSSANQVILNDLVVYELVADDNKANANDKTDADYIKVNYKSAKIVSIIDRPLSKMTCEVKKVNGIKKIVPYHNEISITLSKEITDKLMVGDIILVDVSPNEIDEYSNAKFIKKLQYKDEPGDKDMLTGINYGFDNDYTDKASEEVDNYPTKVEEKDIENRADFRSQSAVTIDGANTKDMDDSIYAEILPNGIRRLYVHIADVGHYIKPTSEMFKRASDKTTSAYINNSVIHMLHHKISNGICSLNPNVDRLALSFIMDIDDDGNIVNFNITESVINSKKKMTYEEVDKILTNEYIPKGYEDFVQELYLLYDIAMSLKKNFDNLEFGNFESKKTYNSDGSIKEVIEADRSPSEELIEYLMLATGKSAGEWLYYMEEIAGYRCHEAPDYSTIKDLINMIVQSGFDLKNIKNINDAYDIKKLLKIFKKKKEYSILSQILVMGMKKADYRIDNLGHYALMFNAYAQVTSPIRRFTDLLNHMKIKSILHNLQNDKEYTFLNDRKIMEEYCKRASIMERQADKASLDGERRLIIEKLEKMIGEEIEATIIMINKQIRIKLMGIDTYIDERHMSDNITFDNSRKLFYDKDSKTYLTIGSKIIVKLVDANSTNRSVSVKVMGAINEKVKKKVLR